MNTHNLIGRNPEGHHDWVSRDYIDIDCNATGCVYNRISKCMVPSQCKITEDGRCEGFKMKSSPTNIDGD